MFFGYFSRLSANPLDGEYFWDGNETLVEAVTDFVEVYHPEAREIGVADESDVMAATEAAQKKNAQRIYAELIPELDALSIQYNVVKSEKGVRFRIGEYRCLISGKSGGRYTLTIWSKTKSTEAALADFLHSQELSANGSDNSDRIARIPMSDLESILESLKAYVQKHGC